MGTDAKSKWRGISYTAELWAFYVTFLLAGIGLITASLARWRGDRALMESGAQTTAWFTSVEQGRGEYGEDTWTPTVSFKTNDGTRSLVSGGRTHKLSVGDTMTVHYERQNADHALINGDEMPTGEMLLRMCGGIAFVLMPLGILFPIATMARLKALIVWAKPSK